MTNKKPQYLRNWFFFFPNGVFGGNGEEKKILGEDRKIELHMTTAGTEVSAVLIMSSTAQDASDFNKESIIPVSYIMSTKGLSENTNKYKD